MDKPKLIPFTVAQNCARRFIAKVNRPARPWRLLDLESCLPAGWVLMRGVEESDCYPMTIVNVARVIRGGAERKI